MREHGLLSTSRMLDLFEVRGEERNTIEQRRRPAATPIRHPRLGTAVINDQLPMTEAALEKCLDDDLSPRDWLAILNCRVFFWSDEEGLSRLLGARANKARELDVIVVDTLSLARAYADRIEICPINSGATLRKPARRGRSTFTPLCRLEYEDWSRQRGRRDKIREVTVVDGVPDIERFTLEVLRLEPGMTWIRGANQS
jgi:hypothetical protein